MKIIWDDDKRRTNIQKHGFDFADAATLLDSLTYTFEDARFAYGERRFITMGMLRETVVVIAHTETARQIRIISMRKATKHEQTLYFENL
jgi:uncharacterized DUF497 family protein